MTRLMVPFDGSDSALAALDHAIERAKAGGEIIIVHAHEPPIVYGEVALYLPEAKAREMQRQHSEALLRPAIERAVGAGVRFSSEILVGNIARQIVERAEAGGCDGIVMGTRGMGALGNLVLGSIATKVVHLTKLPVTLVK